MKDSFLVGNFLAGRESIYRHAVSGKVDGLGPERLETSIKERADRLSRRHSYYLAGVQASLAVVLLIVSAAFKLDFRPSGEFLIVVDEKEVVVMEEIEQTEQIEKPPPPPRPPVPIEVPNDEVLDEEFIALDSEIDFDEPLYVPPPPAEEEAEPEIFVVVEQMPEMIGGLENLYKALRYPEVARLAGIEGNVVIQLLIDENGVPSNPVVLRSAGQILNEAAEEALLKQRFKPGKQRGKAVRVQMAFPVRFTLG
jgi:protein TonB